MNLSGCHFKTLLLFFFLDRKQLWLRGNGALLNCAVIFFPVSRDRALKKCWHVSTRRIHTQQLGFSFVLNMAKGIFLYVTVLCLFVYSVRLSAGALVLIVRFVLTNIPCGWTMSFKKKKNTWLSVLIVCISIRTCFIFCRKCYSSMFMFGVRCSLYVLL